MRKRIYKSKGLDPGIKIKLENEGFELIFGRNLEGRQEGYFFKPFFHESARHAIVICEIVQYLKQFTRKVNEYLTVRPDIIFEVADKKYAVEVETGVTLKKNQRQLVDKVRTLREDFGRRWFFVVTNRNLVRSYKRYGKTYTKRNVIAKINKILKKEGLLAQKEANETEQASEEYY